MKRILAITILISASLIAGAQNIKPYYDSTLATKLGADDRGMKTYVMVILRTGPATIEDKELRDSLFAGHFSNMNKLAGEGKLVAAGPFFDNEKEYRGLFIFNVSTIEEATELVEGDPTVINGIFRTEMFKWYGSASLQLMNDFHSTLEKPKL